MDLMQLLSKPPSDEEPKELADCWPRILFALLDVYTQTDSPLAKEIHKAVQIVIERGGKDRLFGSLNPLIRMQARMLIDQVHERRQKRFPDGGKEGGKEGGG